jgi:hypothetical protein
MRNLMIVLILILVSACNSSQPVDRPTLRAASPTAPPSAPASDVRPLRPTTPPTALAGFEAALRPEFQGDLTLVHSPTVYRMNLRFDPSLAHLSGEESVTYTNRTQTPLSEIYFRLFANYPDGGEKETVTSVRLNGATLTPTLEVQDTALRVPLSQPLAPNGTVSLDLNFGVIIPISGTNHYADLTYSRGIMTLPTIYPLVPLYDDKGWHIELPPPYGDFVYADTSFYDVRFTAPMSMTLIASGTTVEVTSQGAEKTWHVVGAPMRDFDFDLSAVLQKSSTHVGEVTLNSYYLPQDESSGKDVLKWASSALSVYEKRIGPYPFNELDVVETPTTAGGIEYPGLVVIGDELYRRPEQRNYFEFAVAHEVAHQWWYSQVGDDQVNTPWMDESLVQYTTLVYFQDTHGGGVATQILTRNFQDQYNRAKTDGEDMPIGLPVAAYTEREYGEIVYGKGPLFFDAVRRQIGDESFYRFLQTYYQRYKYQVAKPEDLLRTIDEVSGQKVDALYDQWVLGK